MNESEKKFSLSDLVDVKLLQEFQDAFAKTMNVASLTYDDKGPITQPSNFNEFCAKYIKGSELGFKRCDECDVTWGKIAAEKGEPVVYICHAGLTDFAVPIMVEGKHIGTILGGQVLSEPPNEERSREMARQFGVNEEEYIQASKKINIVPIETVKAAANLLFTVANAISEIGYKNLELIKRNERESFYKKIVETVRNTLDINQIKNAVVNEIGKLLNADIVVIRYFDTDENEFLPVDEFSEYKSSPDIKGIREIDFEIGGPEKISHEYIKKNIKENEGIFISNVEDSYAQLDEPLKILTKTYDVKSLYLVPIYYIGQFLGDIKILYTKNVVKLDDENIELLKTLTAQVGTALHQANLYKRIQIQAEREKISRNIVEILRSTLDKNIIKHLFVINIGKFFKADRVFFSDYDPKTKEYLPIDKNSEYLSSPQEKSLVDFDFLDDSIRGFIQPLLEKRELKILSWDEYIKEKPKSNALISRFENANVKSSYNLPVLYQGEIMGYFCIEFTHEIVKLSDEDTNRIRNMCTQAGIALYHAGLYEKAQQSVQDHAEFVNKLFDEFKNPLNKIAEFLEMASQNESEDTALHSLECAPEIEHLNNIHNNAKKLRFLLENVIKNVKTEIDFN